MLDSTLHFHHADYLHYQALKLLGLIRFDTYMDCLQVLYITLIRSVRVCRLADYKLENIQRKFANLCYNDLFSPPPLVIVNQC
jgi:hypothetical protein